MRRHLVGVLGAVLLVVGVGLTVFPPSGGNTESIRAAALRLGPFLLVLWLAFPQLERLPEWFFWLLPILIYLLAFRPRWFFLALPFVLAAAILMPRRRTKTSQSASPKEAGGR